MRAVIAALLAFCLWATGPAHADNPGLDLLGIKSPHWDCNAMMAAVGTLPQPVPCGAFIDDTFGTSDACLRRLLASGKCSSFRGHLAWTSHTSLPTATLVTRARAFDALAAQYPSNTYLTSAICEHRMTAAQSSAVNAAIRSQVSPRIRTIADSGMIAADPTAIRECHGPSSYCPAKSLDGQSATDVDVEAFKQTGSLYSLIWDRSFNCRFSDKDNRPPSKRTDCPNADQFNLLVRYLYPMPPWPPGAARLGKGEIYKPVSENHGGCKGKDCKPVAILNRRFREIRVLAMNGKPLVVCPYFGPFGKQSRYYSPISAFQLGQLAEATAGSEFGYLDAPGYRVVINLYRRGGAMR